MKRLIPLVALLFVAACGGDNGPTALPPTTSAPYSQTDLVVGTGTIAQSGNQVTVAYTGWLHDSSRPEAKGTQFDSQSNLPFPPWNRSRDSRVGSGCRWHARGWPAPPGHSTGVGLRGSEPGQSYSAERHAGVRHHAQQRSVATPRAGVALNVHDGEPSPA